MSTVHKKKFDSPFIWTTFNATPKLSKVSVYTDRIIKIYRDKYPVLETFTTDEIQTVLSQRKLKAFQSLQNEKAAKEAKEKKEKEAEKKEEQKDEDNKDKKDEDKKEDDNKDKDNEVKNDAKEEVKEEKNPEKERELNPTEIKLINALELMENEYYGNEHSLYTHLCNKYAIKIKEEYNENNNTNRVMDKILENAENILCSECGEMKTYMDYNDDELNNGYFLACKECAPDRDSVVTLKWSMIYKSNDTQLKHNNYLAQNVRDSHRYVCAELNNPIKQGMHCWRWYVKGHRSWLLIGISHPKKHRDGSYSEQGVYGIASSGTHYKNGATMYDVPAAVMYSKSEIYIDMRLDLAKSELWYTVVDDAEKRIMKMTGIEKNNKNGWVPHVNVYYQSVQLQIKKIPAAWFGKNVTRCKFKY